MAEIDFTITAKRGPIEKCPYADRGCGFEGTEAEVEDHVLYMITTVQDREHEPREA